MRTIIWHSIAAFVLSASACAQSFVGTFENAQIKLVLEPAGTDLKGTLSVQAKTYPVKASVRELRLSGSFRVGEKEFPLAATWSGEQLELESGGRKHLLVRKQEETNPLVELGQDPPNPLVDPQPPQPQPQPPQPQPQPQPQQQTQTPANTTIPQPQTQAPLVVNGASSSAQVLEALRNPAPRTEDPNRLWTILVYVAADNNLEGPAVADLNEMELGIPASGVEVIVMIDRSKGHVDFEGDWTDARLYRIQPDQNPKQITSPILHRLGEVNTGDPALLTAFIEGGLKAFPARRTALVMWNHGGGWAAMANDDEDGNGKSDKITLPELGVSLGASLAAAGVPKFDILAFDMCLMAQLETAIEVSPYAQLMVASQALEPGAGYPYDRVLPGFANAASSTAELACSIPAAFDAYYDEKKDKSTTSSCIDLARVQQIVADLDALTAKVQPALDTQWPTLARALFFSESYAPRSDFREGPTGVNSLDLLDLWRRVRANMENFPAEAEFQAFEKSIQASVLISLNNAQRRLSTGLAIYAPILGKALDPAYLMTAFGRQSQWAPFLGEVHQRQARDVTPPVVRNLRVLDNQGNAISAVHPLRGDRFEATVEGKNIIWTMVYDGIRDAAAGGVRIYSKSILLDDLWVLRYEELQKSAVHDLDVQLPRYTDGETKVRTEFDGLNLLVSDGSNTSETTFDVTSTDGNEVITFPALLEHVQLGDKPVFATLVVDSSYWNIVNVVARIPAGDGSFSLARLDLETMPADMRVRPLQEVIRDDGESELMTRSDLFWGQGLRCEMALLQPGDYEAVLQVETMGDVSSFARFPYKVEDEPEMAQWAEGWKLFKADDLVGTWDFFVMGENDQMIPRPLVTTIRKHPERPGLFEVAVRDATTPENNRDEVWIVDLAGFKHIRMIQMQDGKEEGLLIVPAFYGIQNSKARIVGKLIAVGGVVCAWEKREAVKSDLDRIQPVQTPEPRPLRF